MGINFDRNVRMVNWIMKNNNYFRCPVELRCPITYFQNIILTDQKHNIQNGFYF